MRHAFGEFKQVTACTHGCYYYIPVDMHINNIYTVITQSHAFIISVNICEHLKVS